MATKFNPLQIIKQTNSTYSGLVIFFHGSGDNSLGVKEWIKILMKGDLKFPHLQIVYPTAQLRPYTPLNGALSNVWFDRLGINPDVPEHKQTIDEVSIELVDFIKNEIRNGIPLDRIVIGGFSMGGAMSLHLAYRYLPEVAGVFTLSSFLGKNSLVYDELNNTSNDDRRRQVPLFMCHGERDDIVPIKWGQNTFKNLTERGIRAEFHSIKNTLHEMRTVEIKQLSNWIMQILPPLPSDNKL